MAPSKKSSHSSSNFRGGVVGNGLASCYIVDCSTNLTGFHYSTTGAGGKNAHLIYRRIGQSGVPEARQSLWEYPPSSPPLAALTEANEFALIPRHSSRKRGDDGMRNSRKEGAARTIRGECERLFCETMKTVFFGEESYMGSNGSIDMDANTSLSLDQSIALYDNNYFDNGTPGQGVDASLEIWDYVGNFSFRGFVGGKADKKSVFAFFGPAVCGRDLKQGLMALIELAEVVFDVQTLVICLDRTIPEADRKALMNSLKWVGFEMITLEMWSNDPDLTSDRWIYLGMEI